MAEKKRPVRAAKKAAAKKAVPEKKLRKLGPTEYYDPKTKKVRDAKDDPPTNPPGGHHSWE